MKKKSGIIGYIVTSDKPMWLDPRDGILYFGDSATLFGSRKQAQTAIDRTYKDHPYRWDFKEMEIHRITVHPTQYDHWSRFR